MSAAFDIYIDEAGDPGVKAKASDEPHWTDWFVLSAVVIDASRDAETVEWMREMRSAIGRKSLAPIHYRNLTDESRLRVCQVLAQKPVRLFVVASHKDSMRRHYSRKLGKATDQVFYNWCLRLLFERVTHWCAEKCRKNGTQTLPAKTIFSQRGGHDYDRLFSYARKIEAQALTGNLTLDANSLTPGVLLESMAEVTPHADLIGLQLADIAASAFFHAANSVSPKHCLDPADALRTRLAKKGTLKKPGGYGLMLLPFPHQGEIPPTDREIFRRGGYRI